MVANEQSAGSIPLPDPTVLTTDALHREISHLRALLEQRIKMMEAQRVELKEDLGETVRTAFASAKEAVGEQNLANQRAIEKSEAATSREVVALRRDIDDLKTRVTTVEQQKVGAREDRSGLYAGIGAISGLIFLMMGIVAFVLSRGGGP